MVADALNLKHQHALLFKLFKAAKTMRAYITHNMENSEELHARLKSLGAKLAAARKTVDEGTELLRNEENGRKAVEFEAHWLAKERDVTEARHKKADEENERLR